MFTRRLFFASRLYKLEPKQGKLTAGEVQYNTILKEHEIKLNEQRRSARGGTAAKLAAFLKPTGWKPMIILFVFFLFQQFSGIYITLFYAVGWFEVGSPVSFPYSFSFRLDRFTALNKIFETSGSWIDHGPVRSFDFGRLHEIPVLNGKHLAVATVQEESFVHHILSGYGNLHGNFGLLHLHHQHAGCDWRLGNSCQTLLENPREFLSPSCPIRREILKRIYISTQVPVACLLLYVCTSMVGMLTIPWTMTAELFPTEIRGIAHSISYSLANVLMFAAVQSYLDLTALMGGTEI